MLLYHVSHSPPDDEKIQLYTLQTSLNLKGKNTLENRSWLAIFQHTVKPALSGHWKRRPKIGFQGQLLLNASRKYFRMLQENAGQKYCRMLFWSILQYFRPSLSYHLSLRPLFCLFLSGRLRQVLLYILIHEFNLLYSDEFSHTRRMLLSIIYFKGSQAEISKKLYTQVPKGCNYHSKQRRPWWNAALCSISSGSSLCCQNIP